MSENFKSQTLLKITIFLLFSIIGALIFIVYSNHASQEAMRAEIQSAKESLSNINKAAENLKSEANKDLFNIIDKSNEYPDLYFKITNSNGEDVLNRDRSNTPLLG